MSSSSPSITLFGGFSYFTYFALQLLLERNLNLKHVVMSAYGPSFSQSNLSLAPIYQSEQPRSIELCEKYDIPFSYVSPNDSTLKDILSEIPCEVFLLACYPQILPHNIVKLAAWGCINIHPSILPKYRGSNPIFWQLRNGETETGVTLHQVSPVVDGGRILTCVNAPYPDGFGIRKIEELLVSTAVEALQTLLSTSPSSWNPVEQDHGQATWQSSPCSEDFTIDATMKARTAYNFVRAYSQMKQPLKFIDESNIYWINAALEYGSLQQSANKTTSASSTMVQFVDGFVVFSVEQVERII